MFELNAQNVVSIHTEDVLCQLKSHKRSAQIYDSVMKQLRLYDDSINKHLPTYCTIGWSSLRWEKWDVDYKRLIAKEEELMNRKAAEEKRVVKLVGDDVKEQIRSLEEQLNFAQNT